MKIVDEKGKLFGKINIIDLLVVLVLVAAVVFLAIRFLGGGVNVVGQTTKITYTATAVSVEQATYDEVLRHMEQGGGRDQLMANGELVDGYVVKVEAVPHVNFSTTAAGDVVRTVEDYEGGRLDVTFTVEANVADPIATKVGTQEVRVAKNHILKTVHFEFPYTTVMTCDWG